MIFIWLQVWYHFHLYIIETGRRTLRLQAIATENLSSTSHSTSEITERCKLSNVINSTIKLITKKLYKSLNELHTCALELKVTGWIVNKTESNVILSYSEPLFHVAKYKIRIDDGLGFTAKAYGFSLPYDSVLYKKYKRFMGNVTISNLIHNFQK